jgi:hypothetical protein
MNPLDTFVSTVPAELAPQPESPMKQAALAYLQALESLNTEPTREGLDDVANTARAFISSRPTQENE